MDGDGDEVKVRTRLELEPKCECDEMCKEQDDVRTLSGTVCGCARCEAPRNR